MKKSLLLLLFGAVFSLPAVLSGQIGMAIEMNRVAYMQFEPVYAKITFRNDSGKALLFGKSPRLQGFLMLEITGAGQKFVGKRKDKEISIDGLVLKPGETRSITVILEQLHRQKLNTGIMRRADEEFERKNYATAKKLYKQEADNGNPAAMYKMGVIYDQGLGEWFADKSRAFRYYRMAADQEFPEAIFKVAEFHEHGMGSTPKDEKTALSWYKRGAELNYLPCLVKIGFFYENGSAGMERNQEAALTCYLRGAQRGSAEAQYRAGRIFEQKMLAETIQIKRDEYKKKAKHYYEEAAAQNWQDARSRLRAL